MKYDKTRMIPKDYYEMEYTPFKEPCNTCVYKDHDEWEFPCSECVHNLED
jgi:hypothetical protein